MLFHPAIRVKCSMVARKFCVSSTLVSDDDLHHILTESIGTWYEKVERGRKLYLPNLMKMTRKTEKEKK